MPPECMAKPACASGAPQSGVMAGTITRSPGLSVRTSAPVSTISPTASWPRIMSERSPMAPSHTVCTSDVQGDTASGRTIASSGPHLGTSFSIHPIRPIPFMASPFIFPCTALSLIFFLLSKSKRLQRTSAFSIAIYTRIYSV